MKVSSQRLSSSTTCICVTGLKDVNSLRPRRNRRHFADDIFKCIFLNENVWILIEFSPKFVPKGPINTISALVQIMAWRRPGDKPLSEPMIVSLPTHICVTRPQWVNALTTGQTDRSFVEDIFKYISANDHFGILIHIWLKFVPKCSILNKLALVPNKPQAIAWTNINQYARRHILSLGRNASNFYLFPWLMGSAVLLRCWHVMRVSHSVASLRQALVNRTTPK